MIDFLTQNFTLTEVDLYEIHKRKFPNKVAFAVLLKFFETHKKFPDQNNPRLEEIIAHIAGQLGISSENTQLQLNSSHERFKRDIRKIFGFKKMSQKDKNHLIEYCQNVVFPQGFTWEQIEEETNIYFERNKIEPLSRIQQTRLLKSAFHSFEKKLFSEIVAVLSEDTKKTLGKFLDIGINIDENTTITLLSLKKNSAELKIDAILYEIKKYKVLQTLNLPKVLETWGLDKLFKKYHDHIQVEHPSHIKAHSFNKRISMLASFCLVKSQEILDTLTDLLLKLIARIQKKAEKHVEKYILSEVKRVDGKFDTLFLLADTSIKNPHGVIQNDIYSAVSEVKLKAIIQDLAHRGKWYKNQVQAKALSLYSHNNRRLVWAILDVLDLETDQESQRDILKALDWVKLPDKLTDKIPFQHVFTESWLPFIKNENSDSNSGFNQNAFELALFDRLSKEIFVKNIWVNGSYRYRNPLKDLPQDFDTNINAYLQHLRLPKNSDKFIQDLQYQLREAIAKLDTSIVSNSKVKIEKRQNKTFIKVSPSLPQAEPQNLLLIQKQIAEKWGSVSLIDILKESDFRVNFSKHFQSVVSKSSITRDTLKRRVLLCLYALGSNTGLKRISAGQSQDSLSDLQYIKLRYIDKHNLKEAIKEVINATIKVRDSKIWGHYLTGCACDSKKISVWDQNLLVEWHARYQGKGVMVYWHVDKKALVINSQLKTCSSSEVAAMLKGVLEHDTLMEMNEIYTDTHWQSTIGFAFSSLLGFELLPRLKNLNKQKLYRVSKKDAYQNLEGIIASNVINWSKIRTYYYELAKYATALKIGTVEAAVLLKRLSAGNANHPVYQALLELGKAIRTIFVCNYLINEDLRIETHESLNVVERVNGTLGFIFYGKLGEISTNNIENQEIAILSLHLLQVCMVYINTLMIQEILSLKDWQLTKEDFRALSPLIHSHITPYGYFIMDMNHRIPLQHPANEDKYEKRTHPRTRKSEAICQTAA